MRRALAIALLVGCSESSPMTPDAAPPDTQIPYQHLSKYGFFTGALKDQMPAPGVVPYDVNAVLYQDGAQKLRFLALPAGAKIGFDAAGRWTWPDGAIIIKTFYYDNPRRLLETRLLIFKGGIWSTHTYLWDDAQQEATRYLPGMTLTAGTGEYRVPSSQQCGFCHGESRLVVPLGPRTRQLNRTFNYGNGPENQLTHFASLGMFSGSIPDPATLDTLVDPYGSATLELRARSYLDANCGHCHNPEGQAKNTNLHLNWELSTSPPDIGVCKPPVAAGSAAGNLFFDIVPGHPEQSIMIFRMNQTDAQLKMPQGPSITPDVTGAALVAQWIAAMPAQNCQ